MPPLTPERYGAILALLRGRGYVRGFAPTSRSPFEFLCPRLVAMDFGFGIPTSFVAPHDYYGGHGANVLTLLTPKSEAA